MSAVATMSTARTTAGRRVSRVTHEPSWLNPIALIGKEEEEDGCAGAADDDDAAAGDETAAVPPAAAGAAMLLEERCKCGAVRRSGGLGELERRTRQQMIEGERHRERETEKNSREEKNRQLGNNRIVMTSSVV